MKKVILVCNNAWALWHFRRNVIEFFASKNFEVILVCPYDKKYEQINIPGVSFQDWKLSLEGGDPFSELKSILELRRIFKKEKPAFVFNYSIKPSIYGSIARIGLGQMRMVSLITGFGFVFLSNKIKARIGRVLYYIFLRFSDEVWFLNKDDLQFFIAKKCIDPSRAFNLPGEGVNVHKFQFSELPHNKIRKILFVGRLLRDKGILHLIEAAKILNREEPIVEIQILGPTWFENPNSLSVEEFENLTQNNFITYLGHTDNVIPFIRNADAVCLPSFREGVPVVLLEAGAMGRVLLASDVPGCREVVVDGVNGLLCKSHSTVDLVRMIREYLKLSDDELSNIARRSREHIVENFSTEKVLIKYQDFISEH